MSHRGYDVIGDMTVDWCLAVDDAFSLINRQNRSSQSASDVAQEVWPTMARSMQKYLRTTRNTGLTHPSILSIHQDGSI